VLAHTAWHGLLVYRNALQALKSDGVRPAFTQLTVTGHLI
jgi:hypothetical protein